MSEAKRLTYTNKLKLMSFGGEKLKLCSMKGAQAGAPLSGSNATESQRKSKERKWSQQQEQRANKEEEERAEQMEHGFQWEKRKMRKKGSGAQMHTTAAEVASSRSLVEEQDALAPFSSLSHSWAPAPRRILWHHGLAFITHDDCK